MRTAKIGPDLRLPMCPPAGLKKSLISARIDLSIERMGLSTDYYIRHSKCMAKLKYSSYVVQESFVSENQDTGAPSFMFIKSHKAFFPLLRVSFQFFALMLCILLMPAEFIQLKYKRQFGKVCSRLSDSPPR